MIAISAGHHISNPGVCYGGICEHHEASRWVDEICKHLPDNYFKLSSMTVKNKVSMININSPKAAIEIHFNCNKIIEDLIDNRVIEETASADMFNGASCLYRPGDSIGRKYAETILREIERTFSIHWDGAMEGYYRMRKEYGVDFFLLNTTCPSVIIVPDFMHNIHRIQERREETCYNIAQALIDFGV